MRALRLTMAIGGCCLLATAALAHVTLATKEAPAAAEYKAVFRVGHGCKGSPTVRLSVEVPSGVVAVKPQPKPGWQIEIIKGPYDRAYQLFQSQVTEGVKVVTWSGGSLPDDYYDEFVLVGHLDKGLEPGHDALLSGDADLRARRRALGRNSGGRQDISRLSRSSARL